MTRSTRAVGALALGAAALLATGCGEAAEQAGEKLAEEAIESETGGDANVDIDPDGEVKIETDEGTISAGSAEVPDSWPSEIPIPEDLEVDYASERPDTGSGQIISLTGTSQETGADLVTLYKDGLTGWEKTAESSTEINGGQATSAMFSLDGQQLTVAFNEGPDFDGTRVSLSYITEPGT